MLSLLKGHGIYLVAESKSKIERFEEMEGLLARKLEDLQLVSIGGSDIGNKQLIVSVRHHQASHR